MRVQQYDAFALKLYAYQLHKTNSFFSLITILISIAIVMIALALNYSTLSHIWLPRSQLPLQISSSIFFPQPLSFSLVCYQSALNASLPSARVLDQSLNPISLEIIGEAQVKSMRPQLADRIGSNFACFNFQNVVFSAQRQKYIIEVYASNATLFLEQTSPDSIIEGSFAEPKVVSSSDPNMFRQLSVQILSASVSDSLMINYQPQIVNTFLKSGLVVDEQGNVPFHSPNIKFGIGLYLPVTLSQINHQASFNVLNLTITRFSIAYIVGTVVSWVSALVLLLGFLISPLMDYKHKLLQAETLFFLKPALRRPSLLKFVVASFFGGLFEKEDHFIKLAEEMERLKNIPTLLKVQKIVKKISQLGSEAVEPQVIICSQSFAEPYPFELDTSLFSQTQARTLALSALEEEEKEGRARQVTRAVLRWFDSGTDEISVQYSGSGHGSKFSVCLSILFALGFLAFLVLFGVFSFDTSTSIYSQSNQQPIEYTFVTDELFFVTLNSTNYSVELTNGNYEYLSTVALTSGPKCLETMRSVSAAAGTTTIVPRCLAEPLTLKYSLDQSQSVLLRFNVPESFNEYIQVTHNWKANEIEDVSPIDSNYLVSYYSPLQQCFYMNQLKIIQKQLGDRLLRTAQIMPNRGCVSNLLQASPVVGYYMQVSPQLTVVESDSNSVFYIMQNVWSLALVCFTVILMKITKYINLRQKNANLATIRAEFRQNICILLAKVNTLLTGRHRHELLRAAHFLKEDFASL